MSNRSTNIIAVVLLLLMFCVAVFSIKDDSLTMDEKSHLPAGYSYLTQKDMRINPEHPPLIKDLAALPLLFIKDINFPFDTKAWKEDVNGQWDFGYNFLYNSDNPTDQMIFWGRIPMILLLILLGFYIFKAARELFGNKTALLSLFFFSFSPTFLAHGRLVTTDVGAAAGIFIATYYFIKALRNPCKKNIIIAGLFFGLAELCKFSAILLIPLFVFLALVWWLIKMTTWQKVLKTFLLVSIIGFILIWPVYQYHTWNYPPQRQLQDTKSILISYAEGPSSIEKSCFTLKNIARCPAEILIWMADKPVLRPYAQYGLGLLMVMQRAAGGNTTYFLGEISNLGWKSYFPIVYAIKVPLAFHILTLIALFYAAWRIRIRGSGFGKQIKNWLKSHFPEFAMLSFIALYWATSLSANLNIGVRHLLPVFPFTILLVSRTTDYWLASASKFRLWIKLKYLFLSVLILWQAFSVFSIYPHFLAYFNEIVGGPDKGYLYTVDSNLDWGQDLKRLKNYTDEKGIDKIYVDYFGGSDAKYHLGNKYAPWWGDRNAEEFPKGNYLAVSATFLQGGRGELAPGFNDPSGYYRWLDKYEPVAKIGYSIFVYYIYPVEEL